jgi:Arc/MetJ-type ribon-helix-helix transcriptional regulator
MPKAKVKAEVFRREYRFSKYIIELINELLETGEFQSEAELVRTAIINLYKDYEAKGKLKSKNPPKSAEERTKNAVLVSERNIKFE